MGYSAKRGFSNGSMRPTGAARQAQLLLHLGLTGRAGGAHAAVGKSALCTVTHDKKLLNCKYVYLTSKLSNLLPKSMSFCILSSGLGAAVLPMAKLSRTGLPSICSATVWMTSEALGVSSRDLDSSSSQVIIKSPSSNVPDTLPMYRVYLDKVSGTLEDGLLMITCEDELSKSRLDTPKASQVIQSVAEQMLGTPVRLSFAIGKTAAPSPEDKMQKLIDFGSKFDSFEVK